MPTKVLIIDPMPFRGGQERHIIELMARLTGYGYLAGIALSPTSPWRDELRVRWGARIHSVNFNGRFSSEGMRQLTRIVRGGEYQVLHAHGGRGGIYSRRLGRRLGLPVVQTWHLDPADWAGRHRLKRYAFFQGERVLATMTDHYIAVSRAIEEALKARYGISGDKVSTIVNRIARPARMARESGPLDAGPLRMVTIGRLSAQKGLPYLLRSIRELKDRHVSVAARILGEGDDLAALQALSRQLDIEDSVQFWGYVSPIDPHLEWAHLFVLPSLWEGTPLVLLEAMAFGLPIVASDVGGVPALADLYSSMTLVKPGSVPELVRAIQGVGNQRDRVTPPDELFDIDAMVRSTTEVYHRVLAANEVTV